ncbi:hypothetical protein ATPR_1809 [Acetobacter tropicalis NBRC 101654]|uniref:Uncharacterized protein n=1 Tax=Acetobacter tropicalis NBRC 101654 TaxID=749388 RepID=F7VEL0_9PROT|nr:hypothetical protein ATPR_1809 [Acetobacter tropicalis NBRC 101654]
MKSFCGEYVRLVAWPVSRSPVLVTMLRHVDLVGKRIFSGV